jgi:transposase
MAPGAVGSAVARRHGMSLQHLFTWRRQAKREADDHPLASAPFVVAPDVPQSTPVTCRAAGIEIVVAGAVLRVSPKAGGSTLAMVLQALNRLFLDREHRGMRCARPRRAICESVPLLPFGHRLRVDAMALGQGSQARLTMLYRSTDCLSRCGAPMENLARSASLHQSTHPATTAEFRLRRGRVTAWRSTPTRSTRRSSP